MFEGCWVLFIFFLCVCFFVICFDLGVLFFGVDYYVGFIIFFFVVWVVSCFVDFYISVVVYFVYVLWVWLVCYGLVIVGFWFGGLVLCYWMDDRKYEIKGD
jgi:hypothetical protein